MDTEQFRAPPLVTGGLKAYFLAHGRSTATTDVELVHFLASDDIDAWVRRAWLDEVLPRATAAAGAGPAPVFGLSCYTWNVAEFLELARLVKAAVPDAVVVAGGPHVQRAQDFLFDEPIDLIVLGEGEETFTELLDCSSRDAWSSIDGLAFAHDGALRSTASRPRRRELDTLPSALDVVPLRGEDGEPLYSQASYETSRGCPFRCAFCEWGTGAIGTKMYQFSLARIRTDLETLVAGGIRDIWLADSNFGALREDEAKADIVVELRRRTGLPGTLATSWSKTHNSRVQSIVRTLHRNGLLSHYHLALQTLTPRALELSNRKNMRANDYEPIVKSLAEEGVPVAAELIWGLPGDTLREFEANLDTLLRVFPNINIFGYTLLPGTEFFDRRDEYRLETVPVAGYGKAKGEYVVGCHTFPRSEGEDGYFLITAYIVLARGQLMPLTVRYLAMSARVPVAPMLRAVLDDLLVEFSKPRDRMQAYEQRADLYVDLLADRRRSYEVISRRVHAWLRDHAAADEIDAVASLLRLDAALCPRPGTPHTLEESFEFAADDVVNALSCMDRPRPDAFRARGEVVLEVEHPACAGTLLRDPDGGEWWKGRVRSARHA